MYYRSMPYFDVEPHTPTARVQKPHPRRFWLLLVAGLVLAPGAALLAAWV
jgi:hypothetical protein